MVFPSADTTRVLTVVGLPLRVYAVSTVVALTRLRTTMSPSGLPVTGCGLPSKLAVYSQCVLAPVGLTVSTTAFTPSPAAEKVTVALFGAGPGLNFDFARLIVQLPIPGAGVCARTALDSAAPSTLTMAIDRAIFLRVVMGAPFVRGKRTCEPIPQGRTRQ